MSSEDLNEYIVTLKNKEDLDLFYEDMETPGGNLYIPNRSVEVANRRPISRNTHYYLTKDEAEQLKNDPRVLDVSLTPKQRGVKVVPYGIIDGLFDRTEFPNSSHRNWGLDRCIRGIADSGIGKGSNVRIPATGKDVDVVIVDGHILVPNHPEFAKNADGTGGSRVIQYNWFNGSGGNYSYAASIDPGNDDHGTHVAGTACGNSQGWASSSNIYNISPYNDNPNGDLLMSGAIWDLLREFHLNKPINPNTGRKNLTVSNHSYGFSKPGYRNDISQIWWRGTKVWQTSGTNDIVSKQLLVQYGIVRYPNNDDLFVHPLRETWIAVDMQDALEDGIIIVAAAGNDYTKIAMPEDDDYLNRWVDRNNQSFYYHRGSSPGSEWPAICVGALGIDEYKASFSNYGKRIDIWAPGVNIQSTVSYPSATQDYRNSTFYHDKYGGTSMASPQVAGVLACAAELYSKLDKLDTSNPNFDPVSYALYYLWETATSNQILDTGTNSYSDFFAFHDSLNFSLFYKKDRPDSGLNWPKVNWWTRPWLSYNAPAGGHQGLIWPRRKFR